MQPAVTSANKLALVLILLVAVGFVAGSTWAIYAKNLVSGSTDIYPTWQGGRLFWQNRTNPYNEIIGTKSQEAIYGRPAKAGEDEFQYVYPFYLILYLGPLPLLEFKLAAAIFMEILLLLLALTLALTLDFLRWLPKPVTLGMLILFVLIQYFSVRGLLLAQPAFIAYALHITAYWSLARRYDGLAGMMLALSTIKPQTGFLIVPLLLIWAWFNHRRGVVYAFALILVALFIISFILLPAWLANWIDRALHYRTYAETYPALHIITHFIDAIPSSIAAAAQIALSLLVLVPVYRFWQRAILQRHNDDFLWGLMVTMAAGLLLAPRVATTYYIELYPAAFVAILVLERRRQIGWIIVAVIVITIGYWVLHIATAPPREEAGREAPIVYVVFPLAIYGWLLWRRADWRGIDILNRLPSTRPLTPVSAQAMPVIDHA